VLVGRRSMVLGRRSLVVGMSRRSFPEMSWKLRRLFGETSASVFSRLLSIARKAKQPKVLRVVGTAVRDRDDMVDLGQSRIAIVPIILVDLDLDAAFLAHASVSFDDRHTESWRDASPTLRRCVGDHDGVECGLEVRLLNLLVFIPVDDLDDPLAARCNPALDHAE